MSEMANKIIEQEEWWPVYEISEPDITCKFDVAVEIPDELIARYEACMKEFDSVQNELRALFSTVESGQ
jgi:hypothetical protein